MRDQGQARNVPARLRTLSKGHATGEQLTSPSLPAPPSPWLLPTLELPWSYNMPKPGAYLPAHSGRPGGLSANSFLCVSASPPQPHNRYPAGPPLTSCAQPPCSPSRTIQYAMLSHASTCLHPLGLTCRLLCPSLLSSQRQQHASRLGSSAMPPPHLMLPARLGAPGRSPAGVLSIPFSIARASNKILPSKWLHTQSTESSRQMSSDAASFRKGSGHGLLWAPV